MNPVHVKLCQLRGNLGCDLPRYQTPGSAGMDLLACIEKPLTLMPGKVVAVPCGISIALPEGFEAQVRPRSGLALRHQVTVLNSPGTVDSDYRGEIVVILANFGSSVFTISMGMRIAQLIVAPVSRVEWVSVPSLQTTERNEGGFGSTGTE